MPVIKQNETIGRNIMKKKKHKWIKEGRIIDIFAAENLGSDYHNGPRCKVCGFEFCHHCNPEGYDTECGTKSLVGDDKKLTGIKL